MNSRQRLTVFEGFKYAGEGVLYALRTQRNFRIHLFAAVVVVLASLWLNLPPGDWALLVLTIGIVLVAEMFNTAAEVLVDLVSPEYHLLAKHVKDLAAGAVLLMALTSVVVGLAILGPPLLWWFGLH